MLQRLKANPEKSQFSPLNHVFAAETIPSAEEKWRTVFRFSVQGTGGSPTGPDPENKDDKDTGSTVIPVTSVLQVPSEPRHSGSRTGPHL